MYSGVVAAREVDDGHARVSTEVHFLRGCVLSRDLDAGGGRRYGAQSRSLALQRGGNRVIGWIVLGVLVLVVLLAVTAYNRLVELRNRYKNAFSQIDVQLKRRYDLIPNLVETAGLQRCGDGLQHRARDLSHLDHRGSDGVRRSTAVGDRARRRARGRESLVRLSR